MSHSQALSSCPDEEKVRAGTAKDCKPEVKLISSAAQGPIKSEVPGTQAEGGGDHGATRGGGWIRTAVQLSICLLHSICPNGFLLPHFPPATCSLRELDSGCNYYQTPITIIALVQEMGSRS